MSSPIEESPEPAAEARRVARGLARALIASLDDRRQALDHLGYALGHDEPWIALILRGVRQRYGVNGGEVLAAQYQGLCDFLAQRLVMLDDRELIKAPPSLSGYFTFHPRMAAAPLSMGAVAVPALATAGELAGWLGFGADELEWFAGVRVRDGRRLAEPLNHYRYRWIAKANGSLRLLEIPKRRLMGMQRRILDEILYYVPPHEAAHGFRPRHSALTHAAGHVGREAVLRMDLRNFFVSVPASRVHATFATLGYPAEVARLLTGLTCHITPKAVLRERVSANGGACDPTAWRAWSAWFAPHLPQGAPSSPALANLCAFNLDMRLSALAADAGLHYTRYADDLAFSGERVLARGVESFKRAVTTIAAAEGFAVNTRKTRLMLRSARQQLTGVVVNAHPNVRRDDYDELKAILHNCVRHGPAGQNRAGVGDFRAHLAGRVSHVSRLNPARGARLAQAFAAITWPEQSA